MWSTILKWFGSGWTFVTQKTRLFVEYIMIGAVIVMGTIMVSMKFDNQAMKIDLSNQAKELLVLRMVNDEQGGRIAMLEEFRERDNKVLQGLATDQKKLSTYTQTIDKKIDDLRRSNAKVETYMSELVPVELGRLLNDSGEGNGDSSKIPPARPALPASSLMPAAKNNSNRNK
jgi:hypothetical protein